MACGNFASRYKQNLIVVRSTELYVFSLSIPCLPFHNAPLAMAPHKKRAASPCSTQASQSATSAGINQNHTNSKKKARASNRQSSEASTSQLSNLFFTEAEGEHFVELGKEFGKLGKESGKLGGNGGKERSLASSRARETCTRCSRLLPSKSFWPEDWRHRTEPKMKIMCKECCRTPRKERLSGYLARNRQKSIEAAGRPITCQACARNLPRTQFRPNSSKGKFDFRKPQTCEQCRAEGKHPTSGPKRRRSA